MVVLTGNAAEKASGILAMLEFIVNLWVCAVFPQWLTFAVVFLSARTPCADSLPTIVSNSPLCPRSDITSSGNISHNAEPLPSSPPSPKGHPIFKHLQLVIFSAVASDVPISLLSREDQYWSGV